MKALVGHHRLALALTLAAWSAHAADVGWRDRGDRWEGIRPANTGAGDFELVGVHLEPEVRQRGADRLLVEVPGTLPAGIDLRVWEPRRGYAMIPKPEKLQAGKPFSWPRSTVLEPEGIEAAELFVLATDHSQKLYYPARLTTAAPTAGSAVYVFRFRSRGGVDLDVKIAREDDGRLVTIREYQRAEDFGSNSLDFRWDGLDSAGKPAPPGVYHFKLVGTVFLNPDLKPDLDLRFVHSGSR